MVRSYIDVIVVTNTATSRINQSYRINGMHYKEEKQNIDISRWKLILCYGSHI